MKANKRFVFFSLEEVKPSPDLPEEPVSGFLLGKVTCGENVCFCCSFCCEHLRDSTVSVNNMYKLKHVGVFQRKHLQDMSQNEFLIKEIPLSCKESISEALFLKEAPKGCILEMLF